MRIKFKLIEIWYYLYTSVFNESLFGYKFSQRGKAALLLTIAMSLKTTMLTKGLRAGEELKQSEGGEIRGKTSLSKWWVGIHTNRNTSLSVKSIQANVNIEMT